MVNSHRSFAPICLTRLAEIRRLNSWGDFDEETEHQMRSNKKLVMAALMVVCSLSTNKCVGNEVELKFSALALWGYQIPGVPHGTVLYNIPVTFKLYVFDYYYDLIDVQTCYGLADSNNGGVGCQFDAGPYPDDATYVVEAKIDAYVYDNQNDNWHLQAYEVSAPEVVDQAPPVEYFNWSPNRSNYLPPGGWKKVKEYPYNTGD